MGNAGEECENCGHIIGKLEQPMVWNDSMVCTDCHARLDRASTSVNTVSRNALPPATVEPTKVIYDRHIGHFTGTRALLVQLAMHAVQQLGWTIQNADATVGLIVFETGMSWGSWSGVTCSIQLQECGEFKFFVFGTGKQNLRGRQVIAFDFGEAEGKAQQVIALMKSLAH